MPGTRPVGAEQISTGEPWGCHKKGEENCPEDGRDPMGQVRAKGLTAACDPPEDSRTQREYSIRSNQAKRLVSRKSMTGRTLVR